MPLWSIAEWRARIGSSWCAIGRPFKTKSSLRHGASGRAERVLTLNQVVTIVIIFILMIGVNLGLCILVTGGHHHPFISEWLNNKL